MTPGKGTMLIYNHRMTDAVINRCHKSAVTATSWSPSTRWRSSAPPTSRSPIPTTTRSPARRSAASWTRGRRCSPTCPRMRILRAYAGVRPLYQPPTEDTGGGNRSISRAHAILDHADQGVENFVSIVGGKLTTHRLMAEQTVDVGRREDGRSRRAARPRTRCCRTSTGARRTGWAIASRTTRRRAAGTRACCASASSSAAGWSTATSTRHWPCTIDDVRRGTRVGMGPCQGAFCTFRVAGPRRRAARRAHGRDRGSPRRAHTTSDGHRPGSGAAACGHRGSGADGVPAGALQGHPADRGRPPAPGADDDQRRSTSASWAWTRWRPRRPPRRSGRGGARCRTLTSSSSAQAWPAWSPRLRLAETGRGGHARRQGPREHPLGLRRARRRRAARRRHPADGVARLAGLEDHPYAFLAPDVAPSPSRG